MYIQRLRTFTAPWSRPSVPVKQMGRKVEPSDNPTYWPWAWGERRPLPVYGVIPYISGVPDGAPDDRLVTFGTFTVRVPQHPDTDDYSVVEDGPGDSGHYCVNRVGVNAVTSAETGASGQTTKLWSPQGRFMPQVPGDGWIVNWRQPGTGSGGAGQEDVPNAIPLFTRGVDAPQTLGFKRTFRARIGDANLNEFSTFQFDYSGTPATGHTDWRQASKWSGVRSPGYEEVKHAFSVVDQSSRTFASYLDPDSTPDWYWFIDALDLPFYERPDEDIWYETVEFAPREETRRQYRCVISDAETNEVTTEPGYLVIGGGHGLNSNIPSVPPQDTTVIGGEKAHFVAQFVGVPVRSNYVANSSSYTICVWDTRETPSSPWVEIEDSDGPALVYETAPGQWIDDVWHPSPDDGRQFRCRIATFNMTNADSAPSLTILGEATLTVVGPHEVGPLSVSTEHGNRLYRLFNEVPEWGGGSVFVNIPVVDDTRAPMVLSCNAVGEGLSYQWQTRDGSGAAWEDIPDATSGVFVRQPWDFSPANDACSRYMYGKGVHDEHWGLVYLFEHRGPDFFDYYEWFYEAYDPDTWEYLGFPDWLEPERLTAWSWNMPYDNYGDWPPFDDPTPSPDIILPEYSPWETYDPDCPYYDPSYDNSLTWGDAPVAGTDYKGWMGTWAYDDDNPAWPPDWGEVVAATDLGATPVTLYGVSSVRHNITFDGQILGTWWSSWASENVEATWENLKDYIMAPLSPDIFHDTMAPSRWVASERIIRARRIYRGEETHPLPLADPGEFKTYITGGRVAAGSPIDVTQAAYIRQYTESAYMGHTLSINGTFGFLFTHRYDIPLPFSTTNPEGDDGVVGGVPLP